MIATNGRSTVHAPAWPLQTAALPPLCQTSVTAPLRCPLRPSAQGPAVRVHRGKKRGCFTVACPPTRGLGPSGSTPVETVTSLGLQPLSPCTGAMGSTIPWRPISQQKEFAAQDTRGDLQVTVTPQTSANWPQRLAATSGVGLVYDGPVYCPSISGDLTRTGAPVFRRLSGANRVSRRHILAHQPRLLCAACRRGQRAGIPTGEPMLRAAQTTARLARRLAAGALRRKRAPGPRHHGGELAGVALATPVRRWRCPDHGALRARLLNARHAHVSCPWFHLAPGGEGDRARGSPRITLRRAVRRWLRPPRPGNARCP